MTPEAFVAELEANNRKKLAEIGVNSAAGDDTAAPPLADLLKLALRNEYEASELAAFWMNSTPELDAKLALARQCGDEAKHYRLIEDRLTDLGVSLVGFDPAAAGPSPLSSYLRGLSTTTERAAAGQFTREALAIVRNEVFADLCEARGDSATASLYRDRIQPDEQHHHDLGRRLLLKYATTAELQERARAAARRTLEIADEVQELMRLRAGICRAPGC